MLWVCTCFVMFNFLTSSSTTGLYRGRVPRLTSDNFTCCHTADRAGETMTSVSAGHIILTPTQSVGSGRPQRESSPGSPRALYRLSYRTHTSLYMRRVNESLVLDWLIADYWQAQSTVSGDLRVLVINLWWAKQFTKLRLVRPVIFCFF